MLSTNTLETIGLFSRTALNVERVLHLETMKKIKFLLATREQKPKQYGHIEIHGPSNWVIAGIIFEKENGEDWKVFDMAPYLRKVLGKTPVKDIGKVLTEAGFNWRWIADDEMTEDTINVDATNQSANQ